MENNNGNGKFLSSLIGWGGWIIAVAAFGWSAASMLSGKVDANELKLLQAQLNQEININGQQDVELKNIYSTLDRIEKKIDKVMEFNK